MSGIIVLLKKKKEILLDLADFALQEQPEDNSMVAISRPHYNGSYTMASKPIKSVELHYTMTPFLIILDISSIIFFLMGALKMEPSSVVQSRTIPILFIYYYFFIFDYCYFFYLLY